MARGGYRAEAYKPERLVEYKGELQTIKQIMADTGFSYSKVYRLFCLAKPAKKIKVPKPAKAKKVKPPKEKKQKVSKEKPAEPAELSVPAEKISQKTLPLAEEVAEKAAQENKTPLEYMLGVMNDPDIHPDRRDRMAMAAAKFCHENGGDKKGKKEEKQDAAKIAAAGRFAVGAPPSKVISMKR